MHKHSLERSELWAEQYSEETNLSGLLVVAFETEVKTEDETKDNNDGH